MPARRRRPFALGLAVLIRRCQSASPEVCCRSVLGNTPFGSAARRLVAVSQRIYLETKPLIRRVRPPMRLVRASWVGAYCLSRRSYPTEYVADYYYVITRKRESPAYAFSRRHLGGSSSNPQSPVCGRAKHVVTGANAGGRGISAPGGNRAGGATVDRSSALSASAFFTMFVPARK